MHEKAGAVALVAAMGLLEGAGVVVGAASALVDLEKVVDAGTDDGFGEEGVLDADAGPVVAAPVAPEYPSMEAAANSEATSSETEEKGIVSDTSEYISGVSKM